MSKSVSGKTRNLFKSPVHLYFIYAMLDSVNNIKEARFRNFRDKKQKFKEKFAPQTITNSTPKTCAEFKNLRPDHVI